MNYYKIALFLNINNDFIYKSNSFIENGSRVIVSLRRKNYCGIILKRINKPEVSYSIKEIREIIDSSSKISANLLLLCQWMSKYYRNPSGLILKAMLPNGLNVIVQETVSLLKPIPDDLISADNKELIIRLNELKTINLKKDLELNETKNLYKWLDIFEEKQFIEIQRTYEKKIKKKIANYIIVIKEMTSRKALTSKQKEAYDFIISQNSDFPVAIFAKKFSYSLLKALREKKYIKIEVRQVKDDFVKDIFAYSQKNINLTLEQKEAVNKIIFKSSEKENKPYLIHGITGSGKTEVYIRVIKHVLQKEKTALMLVPEIALTPQMVNRFYSSFDEDIAILHSHLNDRNRFVEWKKIQSGKCRIVIGVRSAIFAPLDNIGVIIVDEEHETTYKQENIPRYNARDLAVVRGKIENSIVILGSATPSLESWYNAQQGKYNLIRLLKRPLSARLPEVEIIDMKKDSGKELLSDKLKSKIEDRLDKKEQIILFQNRRGYSSFVQCIQCGVLFKCKNCEISMNYHSNGDILKCHYCGESIPLPRKCPDCGSYMYSFGAPGTQQIEKQLKFLFPEARILRMDSDTTTKKDSYDSMFERMRNRDVDILLGTQMISKGLDFEGVSLVGVISADTSLNMPDFRAGERTFQLLTQVAGRSGRGETPGEVIIQTYNPGNIIINAAKNQDFDQFVKEELELRRLLHYPPFVRIARLIFSHEDSSFLRSELDKNSKHYKNLIDLVNADINILGPVECPLPKIKNKYRFHTIIKSSDPATISKSLVYLTENIKLNKEIKLTIDIDPMSLL